MRTRQKIRGGVAAFFLFSAMPLFALIPDLGLVVRHQPMLLKSNPVPLTFEGSIDIDGEKARYSTTWAGINSGYLVKFEKIPASWTTGGINEIWLARTPTQCTLLINKAPHPCLKLRLWSDFELVGSAERVVQTLSGLGIASSSEMKLHSVNSKDFLPGATTPPREGNMKPGLRTVQGTFMSLLEYSANAESAIGFDSTTYAPLYAKLPIDGMSWELSGNPHFYLEKEDNRNNLIINSRIEAREGDKLIGFDQRNPFKRIAKAELPAINSRGSVSDIPFDRFTEKGRNFLKILFLTH